MRYIDAEGNKQIETTASVSITQAVPQITVKKEMAEIVFIYYLPFYYIFKINAEEKSEIKKHAKF
jgi:hypothetical protein